MATANGYTRSLATDSVKKRFVFKSFARRVEEVDVDVFRSLTPVKFEPTSGTSFFQESLIQWRVRLLPLVPSAFFFVFFLPCPGYFVLPMHTPFYQSLKLYT
eukprot:jgi/Mesen1/2147/ME000152S01236